MSKKSCISCEKEIDKKRYFEAEKLKSQMSLMNVTDSELEKINDTDELCWKCGNKVYSRHAVEVYNYNKSVLLPEEFNELVLKGGDDWLAIAQAELGISHHTLTDDSDNQTTSQLSTVKNDKVTTADELNRLVALYHDKFKREWNKNGVVQFKNESIAILQRMWGQQVQFIIAYDIITKEGYRCIAHDEGKEGGQASGGFTGGVNSYFYFQKMDLVR